MGNPRQRQVGRVDGLSRAQRNQAILGSQQRIARLEAAVTAQGDALEIERRKVNALVSAALEHGLPEELLVEKLEAVGLKVESKAEAAEPAEA